MFAIVEGVCYNNTVYKSGKAGRAMDHLTKSQQKVYDFLRQQASTGVPPTVREICTATGLRSTSTVHAHLKTLERLGYISRGAGLNRSIRVEGETPAAQVPILGRVTAGMPILAVEDIEGYLPFPQKPGKENISARAGEPPARVPHAKTVRRTVLPPLLRLLKKKNFALCAGRPKVSPLDFTAFKKAGEILLSGR